MGCFSFGVQGGSWARGTHFRIVPIWYLSQCIENEIEGGATDREKKEGPRSVLGGALSDREERPHHIILLLNMVLKKPIKTVKLTV